MRRFNSKRPKSSEALWYLQQLESGQITPAAVERKFGEAKEALDDALYFMKDQEEIDVLEERVGELEKVLKWDMASSVVRGVEAAVEKHPRGALIPDVADAPLKAVDPTIPDYTHDGFRLGSEDKEEIAKLLKLIRDGKISRKSIEEAAAEVQTKLSSGRVQKNQVDEFRTRLMILDEVLRLVPRRNPSEQIVSKGWDGQLYALIGRNGRPVRIGQKIKSFVITGGRAPHKPESTGRVWTEQGEYFPGVVDAKWVPEEVWKRKNPGIVLEFEIPIKALKPKRRNSDEVLGWSVGKSYKRFGDETGVYHLVISTDGVQGRAACDPRVYTSGQVARSPDGPMCPRCSKYASKPKRRNSDEGFRKLERDAVGGDKKALDKLETLAIVGRAPYEIYLSALGRAAPDRLLVRDLIVKSMARAMFVDAWASAEEEAGRGYSGQELMDVAPETSQEAFIVAEDLAREIEQRNETALDVAYEHAASLDPAEHRKEPTPEDFGHYTAMQSLGHGVSWEDDHPDHGWEVPYTEFYIDSDSDSED